MERRRRGRRRADAPALVTLGAVVLLLLILAGGIAHIGASSLGYDEAVNRSYGAEATLLADQSNRSGAELNSLVAGLPTASGRLTLQQRLDALATTVAGQSTAAAALVPPAPDPAGAATAFVGAMAARSLGVARLRAAVDGLLGIGPGPTPTAGAPGRGPAQVAAEVTAAGSLFSGSDRAYARTRRALAGGPGHVRLPSSVWVSDPRVWALGPATTLVDEVGAAPALAPVHLVQLLPSGVHIDPGALPTAPGRAATGAPGLSVLPPTGSVAASAVVVNRGNVAEHGLRLTVTLRPAGAGRPASAGATVSLGPGASVVAALPALPVHSGDQYVLTVAVSAPPGQRTLSGLAAAYPIAVGPPPPPAVTPTTAAPVTTTTG